MFSTPFTVILVPEIKTTTPNAHFAQPRALLSLLAGFILPSIASYMIMGNERVNMILLKNGRVIDPYTNTDMIADVLIKDDKIAQIEPNIDVSVSENDEIYDCTGCIVGPGLVDIHVHFRDPGFTYKEDILSGAKCSAAGGVTSVILMANTKPTVDTPETLEYILDKAKQTDIHVYTCANITKGMQGKELTDFSGLKSLGAIGFTDDGVPIMDEDLVMKAMNEAAKNDAVLSFHEEDPSYIENNGVNHGKASDHYGIGGSDRMAEISMVKRDIELAIKTGAKINIQHISAKETLDLIRQAKKNPQIQPAEINIKVSASSIP